MRWRRFAAARSIAAAAAAVAAVAFAAIRNIALSVRAGRHKATIGEGGKEREGQDQSGKAAMRAGGQTKVGHGILQCRLFNDPILQPKGERAKQNVIPTLALTQV